MSCSQLLFTYLSYIAQVNLPRDGTTHSGWGFLHELKIKKLLHRHAQGHSDGGSSSVESPFPLVVILTTKISHQRGSEYNIHVRENHNEIYYLVQLIYAN